MSNGIISGARAIFYFVYLGIESIRSFIYPLTQIILGMIKLVPYAER